MNYAIIKSGVVENIIVADAEFAATLPNALLAPEGCVIGWTYADGVFSPGEPLPPPAQPAVYTPLGFFSLFTEEEQFRIANYEADVAVSEEDKAKFRLFKLIYDYAQDIDPNDPKTRSGLEALETIGILAPGRAAEILNGAVGK